MILWKGFEFLMYLFSRSRIVYPPGDSHLLAEIFLNYGLIRLAVRTCETAPWHCEVVANQVVCLEEAKRRGCFLVPEMHRLH